MLYNFLHSSTLASPRHLRVISSDSLPDLDEALCIEEHFLGSLNVNLDLASQVPLKTDEAGLKWKDIDSLARSFCPDTGMQFTCLLYFK